MSGAGRIAGRFELGPLIGEGGVGQVYRAVDPGSGETVAVKVLRSDVIQDAPGLMERFRREGEVLSQLNHPNIVKVRATFEERDRLVIVMDFVAGGSLADLLHRQPRLPVEQALGITLEVADALARAHHLGVIHRDVKPGNILLDLDGSPRLTDFGFAHIARYPPITERGEHIGTFAYLSPEGCNREPLDERTDIWSLGVVLFEMLAGELPFPSEGYPGALVRSILNDPVPSLAGFRSDTSPPLDDLLRRMLAKNRGARLGSMRAVGAEIETVLRGAGHPKQPPPLAPALVASVGAPGSQPEPAAGRALINPAQPAVLLPGKYQLPAVRRDLIQRSRLLERLGEVGHRRLTLISAPAGFGKTTLVAQWLHLAEAGDRAQPNLRDDSPAAGQVQPVAWLSLDEGDNEPARFLQYLITALQQVEPRAGRTVHQVLGSPQTPPLTNLLTALVADLAALNVRCVLVLDDYHTVDRLEVHHVLQFLAEHLPAAIHLVVITREDPPLPLPRLRARGQVTEIRERDLRFTTAEAAAFLNQTMGLTLSQATIDALEARTEGWIAGLQLAGLALQEDDVAGSPEDFVAEFTGNDRYIMDYLVSEVLERQPADMRSFLIETSLLGRLSAPLCDAVTGRTDSRAVLERLEAANLFVMPLDHRREWYRYYNLFAEFLRARLDPARAGELHRRAAQWYETQGYQGDAAGHALAYGRTSGDWSAAERVISALADEQLRTGSVAVLYRWLEALPEPCFCENGQLATYRAWAAALSGDVALAERYTREAERCLPADDLQLRGRLLALQAMLALSRHEHEQAVELATQALEQTGDDESQWRVITMWELAEAQERTRPITEAIASLRRLWEAGRGARGQLFASAIDGFLASALDHHGERREALRICELALARHTDEAGRVSPLAGFVLTRLSQLYYEADEVQKAGEYAEQAVAAAEQLAFPDIQAYALGCLALVQNARGEPDEALDLLLRARQVLPGQAFSDASWLAAWEASIWIQQGNQQAALRWAESTGLGPDSEPQFLRVEEFFAYARTLVACDRLADARRLLTRLHAFLCARDLQRHQISARLLLALVAERMGESSASRDHLQGALKLAVPEGYLRPFRDEDPALLALLAPLRYMAPTFIDHLLAQVPSSTTAGPVQTSGQAAQALVEPLSERELEVLRLIAAGLSNADIADRLVIAIGTVKRHINNIYGKLGVESRTQAVARARELGLL